MTATPPSAPKNLPVGGTILSISITFSTPAVFSASVLSTLFTVPKVTGHLAMAANFIFGIRISIP